jgi:hypothetical protein
MKTNEASWDRSLRIVIGLALLALTVVGPQTPWGFTGLILVATGIAGFCPLYWLFGLTTCPVQLRGEAGKMRHRQ